MGPRVDFWQTSWLSTDVLGPIAFHQVPSIVRRGLCLVRHHFRYPRIEVGMMGFDSALIRIETTLHPASGCIGRPLQAVGLPAGGETDRRAERNSLRKRRWSNLGELGMSAGSLFGANRPPLAHDTIWLRKGVCDSQPYTRSMTLLLKCHAPLGHPCGVQMSRRSIKRDPGSSLSGCAIGKGDPTTILCSDSCPAQANTTRHESPCVHGTRTVRRVRSHGTITICVRK